MPIPASPTVASGATSEPTSPTPVLQALSDRASSSSTADQDPRPTSSSPTSQPVSPSISALVTAEDHPLPISIATGAGTLGPISSSSPVVPIEEQPTSASLFLTEEDALAVPPSPTADTSSQSASPVVAMEDQLALDSLGSTLDIFEASYSPRPVLVEEDSISYPPTPVQNILLTEALTNSAPVTSSSSQQTGVIDIVLAIIIPNHVNTTTLDGIHNEVGVQPISPHMTPQHDSFYVPAVSGEGELTKANHKDVPSRTSSPPAENDENSGDDSRQAQSQGIAEPAPRTKRKHRATLIEGDDEEVGAIEVAAPPSKKIKVHTDAEPDEIQPSNKPKKTVSPKKKASAETETKKDRVIKSTPAPKIGRGTT